MTDKKKSVQKKSVQKKSVQKKSVQKKSVQKKSVQKKKISIESTASNSREISPEIEAIMARIRADIDREENPEPPKKKLWSSYEKFLDLTPTLSPKLYFAWPTKKYLISFLIILAVVLSGFLGRPVIKLLGFPLSPAPFTAIYFDDPHIAGTGIKNNSKVIFGIKNGSAERREYNWTAVLAGRKIKAGSVALQPQAELKIEIEITRATPGDFLEISVDKLKSSIVGVVSR